MLYICKWYLTQKNVNDAIRSRYLEVKIESRNGTKEESMFLRDMAKRKEQIITKIKRLEENQRRGQNQGIRVTKIFKIVAN